MRKKETKMFEKKGERCLRKSAENVRERGRKKREKECGKCLRKRQKCLRKSVEKRLKKEGENAGEKVKKMSECAENI